MLMVSSWSPSPCLPGATGRKQCELPIGDRARRRLSGRLSRGTESHLTLISAPAGFGKTTLPAEWLATSGAAAAELNLLSRTRDR
jgi:ATP/maltotriose-dependent transcriptional regulator MalT